VKRKLKLKPSIRSAPSKFIRLRIPAPSLEFDNSLNVWTVRSAGLWFLLSNTLDVMVILAFHRLFRLTSGFPMYAKRDTIVRSVKLNPVSVIVGETGSG